MKKVVVALGVCLSALLTGFMLRGRDKGPTPNQPVEELPASASSVEEAHAAAAQTQEKSEPAQPSYTKLGAAFAWVPYDAKTARMGYYDHEAKSFYAWKGVAVPVEQIPGFSGWWSGFPLDLRALKVTEVDPPPPSYMPLPDGHFAPGFYDKRWMPLFYRWKGIRLKEDQIPAAAFKKYVLPEGLVKYPIDIDPPQYARRGSGGRRQDH